jgi:hypothetical protein
MKDYPVIEQYRSKLIRKQDGLNEKAAGALREAKQIAVALNYLEGFSGNREALEALLGVSKGVALDAEVERRK